MTSHAKTSAIRRKAGLGRPPPAFGAVTPARALRAAVIQAAQEVAGLALAAGAPREEQAALEPFCAALPEHPMLALLEGPANRFGLLVLDTQLVAGLIEIQTTGRVVPRAAPPRAPTRTDAIMCADFADRLLEILEARLRAADHAEGAQVCGFRFATALEDARAVPLALDNVPYRHFSLAVDIGPGAKSGQLDLLLPAVAPGRGAGAGDHAPGFADTLAEHVLASAATLTATLVRHRITLAEVSGLTVGAVLPLPVTALGEVTLEDVNGRAVGEGRLGQVNGRRALRLTLLRGPAPRAAPPPAAAQLPGPAAHPTGSAPPDDQPAPPPPGAIDALPEPSGQDMSGPSLEEAAR